MKAVHFILVWLALCATPMNSFAQQAIGITAGGKIIASPAGHESPWMTDVIRMVPPQYPYQDRARYHQGSGLFRVTLDSKSGLVTDVTVRKSVGYRTLDNAVISALRQWRVKPGKWKQFDFPITFEMARNRDEALQKMRRLRAKQPGPTFLSE